jgi:predicted NBD/HSP70 family sugar kinase
MRDQPVRGAGWRPNRPNKYSFHAIDAGGRGVVNEVGADIALACVEVGGSGAQTVLFGPEAPPRYVEGVHVEGVSHAALAVPGIVAEGRVVAASNLDWWDVDPAEQLGLSKPFDLVINDAEAAALGESELRDGADVTVVTLGTGVGGAVVRGGAVVAGNLFGHASRFSDRDCPCGRTGCLETVAAGWALPRPLTDEDVERAGDAIARAIDSEPAADTETVVVAGGLARVYPALVETIAGRLERDVRPSAAPHQAKSAAAWGLRGLLLRGGRR